jgi:hypothetical protein
VCSRAFSNSAPADSLDEDKSGLVSMEEFCRLFEPTIVRRASSSASATMDIDDLMKETFNGILVDAKLERSVVIQVPSTVPQPGIWLARVWFGLHTCGIVQSRSGLQATNAAAGENQ